MSNDVYKAAWQKLHDEVYLPQVAELNKVKANLNMLADLAGIDSKFDLGEEESRKGSVLTIKPGAFLNKRLATSVTVILTQNGEPLTLDQIVEYLKQGSYPMPTKAEEERVKDSIKKNTTTFALLPHSGGLYGMKSWYDDGTRKSKRKAGDSADQDEEPNANETDEPEPEEVTGTDETEVPAIEAET